MGLHTARVIPEKRISCPPAAVQFAGVEKGIDMKQSIEISQAQMIEDLNCSFPELMARPASNFSADYKDKPGVWTGGSEACMEDGHSIFSELACPDPDVYDGVVHQGFIAWLDRRGWGCDHMDGGTFLLFPNSHWNQECPLEDAVRELARLCNEKLTVYQVHDLIGAALAMPTIRRKVEFKD